MDPILRNGSSPPLLLQELHTHTPVAQAPIVTRIAHTRHTLVTTSLGVDGKHSLGGEDEEEDDDVDVVSHCGPNGEWEGPVCGGGGGLFQELLILSPRRTLIPCMFSATFNSAAASSRPLWGFCTCELTGADEGRPPSWFSQQDFVNPDLYLTMSNM